MFLVQKFAFKTTKKLGLDITILGKF